MNRIRDFVRGGREGAMVVTGAMTYVPYESEQVAPFTARMRADSGSTVTTARWVSTRRGISGFITRQNW